MQHINSKKNNRESKEKGFTLIELLVVISIISLLSSVVMASLANARMKARNAERATELSSIRTALELYNLQYGRYPYSCLWNGYYSAWSSSAIPGSTCANMGFTGYNTASQPNPYIDWIQGLVAGGFIPNLPNDPAAILSDTGSGRNYLYRSDGTDYKIIANNISGDGCFSYFANSSMRDPARDNGSLPAVVEGNGCGAAGYWTSGAVGW